MSTQKVLIDDDAIVAIIDLLLGLTRVIKGDEKVVESLWDVIRALAMTLAIEGVAISLEVSTRWKKAGLIKPTTTH